MKGIQRLPGESVYDYLRRAASDNGADPIGERLNPIWTCPACGQKNRVDGIKAIALAKRPICGPLQGVPARTGRLMLAYIVASAVVLAALALDNLLLRIRMRRERGERAAAVAAALSGTTHVAGVELPAPDLEWAQFNNFKVNDLPVHVLKLGGVYVTEKNVFVGSGSNIPPMPVTQETKNYCAAVWKAYRSRVARKAITGTS